jgi:hypothetical protein
MRLDVDVIREILLSLEDSAAPTATLAGSAGEALEVTVPGRTSEEVSEHVRLLEEGGYLQAIQRRRGEQLQWFPARLTWSGHQMLEAMRSRQVFEQAKRTVTRALGHVSLEAMRLVLASIREAMLKQLG